MTTVRRPLEETCEPCSFASVMRTSMAQLQIFKERSAPPFVFLLSLAIWSAALYRIFTESDNTDRYCLLPDTVFRPHPVETPRYFLHALWPLEAGYVRGFLLSVAFLIQGYVLEYEVGTAVFFSTFLGMHVAVLVILLYFKYTTCFVSIEPAIAAMAAVMHRQNPKLHTDGLAKDIQVPFPIEPRWHVWFILSVLLLLAGNFAGMFACHATGILVGFTFALRDPDAWEGSFHAFRTRHPALGRGIHVALLLFALLFMPLTCPEPGPPGVLDAVLDGRAFRPAWWQTVPASLPLLHMGLLGEIAGEALFICKLITASAVPLTLSPMNLWTKCYSIACVLLAMYAMTSPRWLYPHVGFVTLLYLAWAFWKMPPVDQAQERKRR